MAGGIQILLGLNRGDREIVGNYVGTGMHGGALYIRDVHLPEWKWGPTVFPHELDDADHAMLRNLLTEFCADFGFDVEVVLAEPFLKLQPRSSRPYAKAYS